MQNKLLVISIALDIYINEFGSAYMQISFSSHVIIFYQPDVYKKN